MLSVQILCRVETPLKGRGQAKQIPLPPTGGNLGFELSWEQEGMVRGTEGMWPTPVQPPAEVLPLCLGVLGGIMSFFILLIAFHTLPFLPGVQARERQPAEPPGPLRRRAASDGQYENQSPEATSPRSPGVRSPVQCVTL